MLEVITLLIFLLPLVPVLLLLAAKSNSLRRAWLLMFACTMLVAAAWYTLLSWVLNNPTLEARGWLFNGVIARTLFSFLTSALYVGVYTVILAVIGYFANRIALQRLQH